MKDETVSKIEVSVQNFGQLNLAMDQGQIEAEQINTSKSKSSKTRKKFKLCFILIILLCFSTVCFFHSRDSFITYDKIIEDKIYNEAQFF